MKEIKLSSVQKTSQLNQQSVSAENRDSKLCYQKIAQKKKRKGIARLVHYVAISHKGADGQIKTIFHKRIIENRESSCPITSAESFKQQILSGHYKNISKGMENGPTSTSSCRQTPIQSFSGPIVMYYPPYWTMSTSN